MATPANVDISGWTVQGSSPFLDGNYPASGRLGITSVTGTISADQSITINGAGFSTGPANHTMENFSGGVDGNDITTGNTVFDEVFASSVPTFNSDARSSGLSADTYKAGAVQWEAAVMKFIPGVEFDEWFSSYARKTPSGKTLPHAAAQDGLQSSSGTGFYNGSDDKYVWFFDATYSNDVCMPTRAGWGEHHVAGNTLGVNEATRVYDSGGGSESSEPDWWNKNFQNNWYRFTGWFQAGDVPQTDPGKFYFNICNAQDTLWEYTENGKPIFAGGASPYTMEEAWFPGWMRERTLAEGHGDVQVLYDDCYFAWGANSAARVEIGNASTYATCTDLAICPSTSWADGAIAVTLPDGPLSYVSDLWLYVTRENNTDRVSYKIV